MISSEKGKGILVKHVKNSSKRDFQCQTCKYYRKESETFDIEHLGPKGLCLDLYYTAYPYFLALLYGAEFSWERDKNIVHAQCPAPAGNIHFEVKRIPLKDEVISKGIKKKCRIILRITKIEEADSEYANNCVCTHKVGQEFEFNQGDFLSQMCPAAFYSIYPVIKTLLNDGKACWENQGKVFVQCPDNNTKIMFEITKGNKRKK